MTNTNTSQVALVGPYVVDSSQRGAQAQQLSSQVIHAGANSQGFLASQAAALVVYAPAATRHMENTQNAALVVYASAIRKSFNAYTLALMAVYGKFTGVETRSRAWSFSLDGHTFYALDLGQEGTFLYDVITGQWSQFQTAGYVGWNMRNGTLFGEDRIAGADLQSGEVWELDPDALRDEGFRDVTHAVTGAVETRSRVFVSCDALRLTASVGHLTEPDGAIITLRFSDDSGNTWSDPKDVTLTEKDFSGEIAWRSLGSFMAPGRVFQITDVGGVIRIDGADAFVDNYDG